MRTAVIGIGSNSLRMLVADITDDRLNRLHRYRRGLRVFAALDSAGNITPDVIQTACDSVKEFQVIANERGASSVCLFATSAVRDAKNQVAFTQALQKATGLTLEVCSGECEALLSFRGAANAGQCGVIDIGGGSTEIVCGNMQNIEFSTSLQMGAVRLSRKISINTIDEAYHAVQAVKSIVKPCQDAVLSTNVANWIGVGGTFTTLAALVQRIPWDQKELIHGFTLTKEDIIAAMEHLAPMPISDRLELPYLQPQRADIIVHGIAVLLACMTELHISKITVSEYGNLEGYLKTKYLSK